MKLNINLDIHLYLNRQDQECLWKLEDEFITQLKKEKVNRFDRYYHKTRYRGVNVYDKAEYILSSFVGKPVNDAYSKFCGEFPQHFHEIFFKSIAHNKEEISYEKFYIDDNGNIEKRIKKRTKKTYTLASADYKEEYRHKITGEVLPMRWNQAYFSSSYYTYDDIVRINPKFKAYQKVVVSGYVQTFTSKNDYRVQKFMYEKRSKERRLRRIKEREEKRIMDELLHTKLKESKLRYELD